jgi:DNA-binding SARP family transcriptional activator/tetratricopeptide (TPR) repeat protein
MEDRPGGDRCLGIAFLGQPRFTARGKPHPFRGRPRTLALLAFLLLHRDAHLTRDALAFTLWPDDSESEARSNLRRHLHHLNVTLPASDVPYVVTQDDTIGWNAAADVWFDVDAFERSVENEHDDALDAAVALYGGDLLPGIYDDWIFPIRDRLRRAYLAALETLMLRSRSRRDLAAAKDYAGAILRHDPWREDTLRQLVSIRYEAGDRAGALRELDAFAERLHAEMHVEPMPETLALRSQLLRGAGVWAGGGAKPVESLAAAHFFPFVGRAAEREQLEIAWRRAARGRGDVIFVAGEAGIGKSRLVSEVALVADAQGGRVLRGWTTSPEPAPYAALVQALRDALPLLQALDIRPIWLAVLAVLVPELALIADDLPPVPPLDPPRERLRLFEALASVLNGLARQRPILLVVEDIHWAGEATLGALEYLARRSAAMPALIVATYRSDARDAQPGLATLRRRLQLQHLSQHLTLGGLGPSAIGELAHAIPELREQAADVGREIHAVSGGNPLFAGELLRERAERGPRETVSSGLGSTLAARVGRLSENAAHIAQIAGVAGATFEVDLIRDVCGWNENSVLDAVQELLERNLVREVGHARFAFAFTHALIEATIYETIEGGRRRSWHERVALSIERLTPDRDVVAGTLAAHFDAAGIAQRAWPYYLTAARHAFAVFANEEALAAATRALELGPAGWERFDIVALRERVRGRLGDRESQRADIEELSGLAAARADADAARADVLWRRALFARAGGEVAAEGELLAEYLAAVRLMGDRAGEAAARCASARNLVAASRYDEADAAAADALERYEEGADREGQVEALCLLSEIAINHGRADRAQAFLESAQRTAAQVTDRGLSARVAMARATAAIMRRDFTVARESAQEALLRYREIGDREGEAEALTRVATALSMLRRFDEARAYFKTAADIYRSIGNRRKLAYLSFNASPTEMQLGLFAAAETSLNAALAIFAEAGDPRGLAVCRTNLSMIRLLSGAPAEAQSIGLHALADARAIENPLIEAAALANLGNAERELGQFAEALEHMHAAIGIRRRLGLPATFEELGDLALAQLASGDRVAGRGTADDIMRRAPESNENTVWPHYCFWAAACVYRACSDEAGAARALEHAVRHVREQVASITDEISRAAFAELGSVRAVRAASEGGGWPSFAEPVQRDGSGLPVRSERLLSRTIPRK